jgi:8-oxo-dGTP pyrophosphatase MutT (NUDIX family)
LHAPWEGGVFRRCGDSSEGKAIGGAIKGLTKKARTAAAPGRQYAALPYRYLHSLEILLISSRETRRWVIPKGWPMKGRKPHAVAAREALEEAGVVGRIGKRPVGSYQYVKRLKNGAPLLCTVEVFPMMVERQRDRWREQDQRTARWFPAEEAAAAVEEPELQALIDEFAWNGVSAAGAEPADAEATPTG